MLAVLEKLYKLIKEAFEKIFKWILDQILDPVNHTALGLSLIVIYFEIFNYFIFRSQYDIYSSMLSSYTISVLTIILYSVLMNYYFVRTRVKGINTTYNVWLKQMFLYRVTIFVKTTISYSILRFLLYLYIGIDSFDHWIVVLSSIVLLGFSYIFKSKSFIQRILMWISIIIALIAPLSPILLDFLGKFIGVSIQIIVNDPVYLVEYTHLRSIYYKLFVAVSILLLSELMAFISVFALSKVIVPGLKLHMYIHYVDNVSKYNILGLTELAILGNIISYFLVYRSYLSAPLYIKTSINEVPPPLILIHNVMLLLFVIVFFYALVYGIYVYYSWILDQNKRIINLGYNVFDKIIYVLYFAAVIVILEKLYMTGILGWNLKGWLDLFLISVFVLSMLFIGVYLFIKWIIGYVEEKLVKFLYSPGWKTMFAVLLVPIISIFATDYALYMYHVVSGEQSLNLAIMSYSNCTAGAFCIFNCDPSFNITCRNTLDVIDLNYLIFITMTLRFGVAVLVITSLFAISFLYLKRNVIPHFIYYLVDKKILFGLISATLVALIPIELEFNAIRDSYLNYLSRLLVFPTLYEKTILNGTVYNVELIGGLIGGNYDYYSPSILGAIVSLTLYMVVISSLSVFVVSIYRIDKHFDHSILEYLKRHIGNLLSRTSKVRLIVAGFGSLGESFLKTILSYNVLENLHLLYLSSYLRNTIKDNECIDHTTVEKRLRSILDNLFIDEIDIIMILDFRRTSFGKVDYRVSLKNVVIVEKSLKEWYYAIKHDVLNYIGLKYVKYSYGEGVYVPVIVNDITNEVVLSYLRVLSRKTKIREEEHLTLLYLLIDNPNDVLNILIKLDNFEILKRNDIFIITRAFSSPETQNMLSELIKGHLQYVYLDYYMGHVLFGNLLPHLISNYKRLTEVKIYSPGKGARK